MTKTTKENIKSKVKTVLAYRDGKWLNVKPTVHLALSPIPKPEDN